MIKLQWVAVLSGLFLVGCVNSDIDDSTSHVTFADSAPIACGAGFGDCAEGTYCLYKPQNECGQEGPGNCIALTGDATEEFGAQCTSSDPVCGCDSVTYANACAAASAGQLEVTLGECPGDPSDGPGDPGNDPGNQPGDCAHNEDGVSRDDLDCRGPNASGVAVDFDCGCVNVTSCKDLSNVVVELADGSHFKFDDLNQGADGQFCSDQSIVGVWVKAGNNKSGDGPGYGERFTDEDNSCECDGESNGGNVVE